MFAFGRITAAIFFLSAEAAAGSWSAAAPMSTTRQYPGLARLGDGRILAVTGHPLNGQSLSSTEVYDPDRDEWRPTGPLNVPRNGVGPGGLVVLSSGKVFITGGGTGSRSAHETELFDPATGIWNLVAPMHESRDNHTTTLLPDGRVLVVGGIDWATDEVRASAEIYDAEADAWSACPPLPGPRVGHCAVLLDDGRVLIMGGASESDVTGELATALLYDPETDEFRGTAPMHEARRAFRALTMNDGRVIVVGGSRGPVNGPANQLDSVEIFDSARENWSNAAPLLEGRWGPTATRLSDGSILVAGGMYGRVGRRRTAEIFDPVAGAWRAAGSLAQARNGHRDIALDDGRILIVGGFSGRDYLASCEIFTE